MNLKLENMRKFYIAFSKSETASRKFKLSWSHYTVLPNKEEFQKILQESE